jgi:protein phosphatase
MRRAVNQDAFAVRICNDYDEWARIGHLFVVADGIGGHAVGDLASRICVDTLPIAFSKHTSGPVEDSLHHAILAANKAINDRARENREFEGMGTTCTALSLSAAGAIAGHVGDSRLYRVRRGLIQQLTFDHSLQWEMVRLGRATPEDVERFHPRNVITRCLGPDTFVQVDIEGPFPVEPGDIYMLCSDGVTNHVSDPEIGVILSNMPPAESSRLLINLANLRGGYDNSTAVVVNVESYPAPNLINSQTPPSSPTQPIHTTTPANNIRPPIANSIAAIAVLAASATLAAIAARFTAAALPRGPAGFATAGVVATLILFLGVLAAVRLKRPKTSPVTTPPPPPHPQQLPDLPLAAYESTEISPPDPLPGSSSDQSYLRSSFNSFAPYRSADCRKAEELLTILTEAHNELIQASRDNAWNVDLAELAQLDRQATAATQTGKLDRALRARGRAIDIVMRELPQKQRPSN